MKSQKTIEDNFIQKFNNLNLKYKADDKEYIIRAVRPQAVQKLPFDLVILVGNKRLAIIDFKDSINLEYFDYEILDTYSSEHDIRYFIWSDGEKYFIKDQRNIYDKLVLNFNDFVNLIIKFEYINIHEIRNNIADIIKKLIIESDFIFLHENIENIYSSILYELDYDVISQVLYFIDYGNINNVENRIFRLLLKDNKPLNKIYRYTSSNAIYSCLNNNSYRMNCIIGMNDTTEVNYTENYLFGTNKDFASANWKRIENYNNKFISSCTLKRDDLTQWRLYADDSKGVCLEFKVINTCFDSNFILMRISYGKKNGKHPELDLLINIRQHLKQAFNVELKYKTLNTWKHFFKPYDYSVEEEVRLLYIHNNEEPPKKFWNLTNTHQILNPFVEFKLNDSTMPIRLNKILLGPKTPEKEINKKQLQQFIRELRRNPDYDLAKVEVDISSIRNYR